MCIISLDREKFRLLFDVLFVTVAFIDSEISPFYQSGSAPLVSILKYNNYYDWTTMSMFIFIFILYIEYNIQIL